MDREKGCWVNTLKEGAQAGERDGKVLEVFAGCSKLDHGQQYVVRGTICESEYFVDRSLYLILSFQLHQILPPMLSTLLHSSLPPSHATHLRGISQHLKVSPAY